MNTDHVIERLAQDLSPAARLAAPWIRAAWWLIGAAAYFGLLAWMMGSPSDAVSRGPTAVFSFSQMAAMVTAAAAVVAAFASSVPGYHRRIFLFPALAAAGWLGSLTTGALHESTRGDVILAVPGEWGCVAMIVVGGAVPAFAMTVMLRRGAPLTPALTAGTGMLGVATLASVSACVSQPHPSDAVTLLWHGTAILAVVLLAAWGACSALRWRTT
jgi:hypothetical protein